MKTKKISSLTIFTLLLMFSVQGLAQSFYVKQVITANSGKFEFAPPYTDYVTLETYNPGSKQSNVFSTIFTQSAQAIVIAGNMAFIEAEDSLAKYNLNTLERVSIIADSGLNRLALYNGKLIVSKQYPVIYDYLEVLDTANLEVVAQVQGISGDCGGICSMNDTVYLAVNGGYLGTEGKLAIIDPRTWTLKREVNFGHLAIGIWDLFPYKGRIFSVNMTPYGVIDSGSVSVFTPSGDSFQNVFLPFVVAPAAGVKDSLLYLGLNNGIGSFNMNSLSVADTIIVPDPGSAADIYIRSSVIDTLNGRIYANIGNDVTPGNCLVTSLSGDSITSYTTGISSDAIALDYRQYSQGVRNTGESGISVNLFPNPATNLLNVSFSTDVTIDRIVITDLSGREVKDFRPGVAHSDTYRIAVDDLMPGTFWMVLYYPGGRIVKPFVVGCR